MKNLKLKFARMEKGLSQIELAEKVGVTRQTIGMMEAGDYNPSLKLCTAICRELGKTLNDLFWDCLLYTSILQSGFFIQHIGKIFYVCVFFQLQDDSDSLF